MLAKKNTHILFSVGDSAKYAFHSNPENTVFDAKRLIGHKMDDQDITRDMKHWPFKVTEKNGKHRQTQRRGPGLCKLSSTTIYRYLVSPLRKLVPWFSPR